MFAQPMCVLLALFTINLSGASLLAQTVKTLPAMQETQVQSLGWEDPLEKGKAMHSSILAWRIPWTVQSMRSQRVEHDSSLCFLNIKGEKMYHQQINSISNVKENHTIRRKEIEISIDME